MIHFSEFPTEVSIETLAGIKIEIECLKSMDAAIDFLCEKFKPQTKEEEQKLFDLCPYFGMIWPSGKGLAQYLAKNHFNDLKNKTVLEFGCGLALPSLFASKAGARVTAIDYHPDVKPFLERNLKRNQVDSLRYLELDWQSPNNPLAQAGEKFDFVIGSDILYEKRHIEPVAQTFYRYATNHSKVILADPGRGYLQQTVDELKRLGFKDKEIVVENGVFVIELHF